MEFKYLHGKTKRKEERYKTKLNKLACALAECTSHY